MVCDVNTFNTTERQLGHSSCIKPRGVFLNFYPMVLYMTTNIANQVHFLFHVTNI